MNNDSVEEITINVSIFGPMTYRESYYGLIFERIGINAGKCIGYSVGKTCLTASIRPLTTQLIKICQELNIPYC